MRYQNLYIALHPDDMKIVHHLGWEWVKDIVTVTDYSKLKIGKATNQSSVWFSLDTFCEQFVTSIVQFFLDFVKFCKSVSLSYQHYEIARFKVYFFVKKVFDVCWNKILTFEKSLEKTYQ